VDHSRQEKTNLVRQGRATALSVHALVNEVIKSANGFSVQFCYKITTWPEFWPWKHLESVAIQVRCSAATWPEFWQWKHLESVAIKVRCPATTLPEFWPWEHLESLAIKVRCSATPWPEFWPWKHLEPVAIKVRCSAWSPSLTKRRSTPCGRGAPWPCGSPPTRGGGASEDGTT